MIVKLLTEHHLEFPSLKGGCRGSSESTLVKMLNCWKSHAAAQLVNKLAIRILTPNANQGPDECSLSITKLGVSLVRHKFQQNLSKNSKCFKRKTTIVYVPQNVN